MPAPRKYDQETRDRAVRMFLERRQAHPGESAIESRRQVGRLVDVNSETIRGWVDAPRWTPAPNRAPPPTSMPS